MYHEMNNDECVLGILSFVPRLNSKKCIFECELGRTATLRLPFGVIYWTWPGLPKMSTGGNGLMRKAHPLSWKSSVCVHPEGRQSQKLIQS